MLYTSSPSSTQHLVDAHDTVLDLLTYISEGPVGTRACVSPGCSSVPWALLPRRIGPGWRVGCMPWNNLEQHRTGWSRYQLRVELDPSIDVYSTPSVASAVSQSTQGAAFGTSLRSCPGKGFESLGQCGAEQSSTETRSQERLPQSGATGVGELCSVHSVCRREEWRE